MATRRSPRTDVTPAGRLEEARLHEVLGYQMAQASIVTGAVFQAHAGQPFGLRPVEYTLLTLIVENPGGSLARLARALAVTAPNITMWIDKLEARGLVRRQPSPTDRRALVLHATAEGEDLARQATQQILQAERAALATRLSPAEHAMLLELLHKVACARQDGTS
jgi:DNA-binding MarR family transcriptional regulator